MKLKLASPNPVVAMLLVANVADGVAQSFGLSITVVAVTDTLDFYFESGEERTWDVAVANLRKALGVGFLVNTMGDGMVTVSLGSEPEAEELPTEEEPTEVVAEPEEPLIPPPSIEIEMIEGDGSI